MSRLSKAWDGGDGPWTLRRRLRVPYPLRAARISLELQPFGFWWKPSFRRQRYVTESAKQQGETIWWARWAWFQVSYGRWV